jgi:hypothetical protein
MSPRPSGFTLAAAAFLACVPGALPGQATGERLVTRLQGFDYVIALDTLVYARAALDAPRAEALAAVREVYAALKLPKVVTDTVRGAVGNTQFSASTLLAGERMSTYLRCGSGPSGENADYFRVTMAIATFVEADGAEKSRVGTGFAASARDMGGAAKPPQPCASTGLLEARIATMVKERLASR